MSKKIRHAKTSLKTEGLVGVITKYELSEKKWELLGCFDGNNVYKRKYEKTFIPDGSKQ